MGCIRKGPIAALAVAALSAVAGLQASTNSVVAGYHAAACVAPLGRSRITPNVREWDATLTLRDGVAVNVRGADMVGGAVFVVYPDGEKVVAANAGDYVYPEDVRFDLQGLPTACPAATL